MPRPTVLIRLAAGAFVALFAALVPAAAGAPTVATATSATATAGNAAAAPGNRVAATPALVRQVQFLLSSIGIDPGPIDGVPRQLTNAAVHKFEQQAGLPLADLVSSGQISTALLDRLRKAAAGVLLGTPQPPAASAPSSAPPPAATAPAPAAPPPAAAVAPPAADRFAACPYAAADFLIGGKQYTPDSFLQTGFDGSLENAVPSLRDRLQEAREVAQEIGGPALKEVQRQARVLSYFECRLKIAQGTAAKN